MLCYISARAISTVVAHFLHTEGVTGSNPVSPIDLKTLETEALGVMHRPQSFGCDGSLNV